MQLEPGTTPCLLEKVVQVGCFWEFYGQLLKTALCILVFLIFPRRDLRFRPQASENCAPPPRGVKGGHPPKQGVDATWTRCHALPAREGGRWLKNAINNAPKTIKFHQNPPKHVLPSLLKPKIAGEAIFIMAGRLSCKGRKMQIGCWNVFFARNVLRNSGVWHLEVKYVCFHKS